MMHSKRRHRVKAYATAIELAHDLLNMTWTTCSGFSWGSLVLLNDATSEDGAQEYGVLRNGRQIESLTVSWMDDSKVGVVQLETLLTKLDRDGSTVDLGPGAVREHEAGDCHACA
jgi:hypothetical protein